MGCGASKNDVIKSASSDILPKKKDGSNDSAISEASTIPAHDGDMYQQNGKPPKVLPPLKPLRNPREKPPGKFLKVFINITMKKWTVANFVKLSK